MYFVKNSRNIVCTQKESVFKALCLKIPATVCETCLLVLLYLHESGFKAKSK